MNYDYENNVLLDISKTIVNNNFNYNYYINVYNDIKNLNYEEAYSHWKKYGIKENRICNESFNIFRYTFDYELYLHLYDDLKHFNYENALNHFTFNGINENRICYNKYYNTNNHITLCIQLNDDKYLNTFFYIIKSIKYIFKNINVIITVSIFKSELLNKIKINKNYNSSFTVLTVEDYRSNNDVYPFLKSLQYIHNNNIKTDFILKLHNYINNYKELHITFNDILKTLTSYNHLLIIQNYFKTNPGLGYICNSLCLQNKVTNKNKINNNINDNINIKLKSIYQKYVFIPTKYNTFIINNIYWINYDILNVFFKNNLIDSLLNNLNKDFYKIFEKLVTGLLCNKTNNILINNNPLQLQEINLGKINDNFYKQPQTFSIYRQN